MQAPGTQTAACLISRSAASAGRRHDAAERIVGSALEPYTAKPDRQVFLIDVEETWVARYEYELQDGAPVFTAVRVFAGTARDVGYGPNEAGPPSPGGLTATALAKVTPGAHLSALYRELRERAEEAERKRARGPRLSELAGKPPFPPDYTKNPCDRPLLPEEYGLSTDELARPHRRRSRTGADRCDVRYAGVAYLYSEKVRADSRRVAEEIAEQLGGTTTPSGSGT